MLFSKLSLFTIGCVLMDNALRDSLVNRALRRAEQLAIDLASGKGGLELFDLGLHRGFDHAIAQVLFLVDLHALHGGLDIRQSVHLPRENQHHLF